jgi:hypothetical protein
MTFILFISTLHSYLDPDHHVEVSLRVLFNDVPHIVRLPCLLKLATGDEVFDLPDGSDGVFVRFRQTGKHWYEFKHVRLNVHFLSQIFH